MVSTDRATTWSYVMALADSTAAQQ